VMIPDDELTERLAEAEHTYGDRSTAEIVNELGWSQDSTSEPGRMMLFELARRLGIGGAAGAASFGQLCLGCPGYAWDANGPGDVYGPEQHPLGFGSDETPHEWQPADIAALEAHGEPQEGER